MDSSASGGKSSPTEIKRKKYSKTKDKYSKSRQSKGKKRLVSFATYESRRSSEYGQFWSKDYCEKGYENDRSNYKNVNYLFKKEQFEYFEPSRGKKWGNYADRFDRSHSSSHQLDKDWSCYSKGDKWSRNSKRDRHKEVRSPEINRKKSRLHTSKDKNIEPWEESKHRYFFKEIASKRKPIGEFSGDIESIHSEDSQKDEDTSKIINISSSDEEPITNNKTAKSVKESESKTSKDAQKENISKTVTLISNIEQLATNDTPVASKGAEQNEKRSKFYRKQESSIDHYSYLIESDSSSEKPDLEAEMRSNISDTSEEDDGYNPKIHQNNKTDITMHSNDDEKHSHPSPINDNTSQPKFDLKELPSYFPAIQGSRFVEEYHRLNRIEEGTYGVVYRARDKRTNEIVALKRLKMEKEREGFPITSLREINTILKAQHPNIVTVREIVVGCNMDKIYIVMDFVELDLKSLMETMKQPSLLEKLKH